MAQRVATWCNAQPWHVTIARAKALDHLREELGIAVEQRERKFDIRPPIAYEGVYADRRHACGHALYRSLGIARDDHTARRVQAMKNYDFFGAQQVAFISAEALLGDYALVDAGAYVSTFILAAESLGVATVVQGAIAQYSPVVHRVLDLPTTHRFVAAIAYGYEDPEHPANTMRTERAPLNEVVRRV